MIPQQFRRFRALEHRRTTKCVEADTTNKPTPKFGSVTIGGKTYKTVKIGNQEWMAENLELETDLSYKDPSHPEYGRYYEWYDLTEIQSQLPSGWRVPDNSDWNQLIDAVGGADVAGTALKSKEFNGNDEYGFSGLPAGYRDFNGSFNYQGSGAYWWSATESGSDDAFHLHLSGSSPFIYGNNEGYARSVRCVRDSNGSSEDFTERRRRKFEHRHIQLW